MTLAKAEIDLMVEALAGAPGEAWDPVGRFEKAGDSLQGEMASYFEMLRAQLPAAPEPEAKILAKEPAELVDLRTKLDDNAKRVATAVQAQLDKMKVQVREAAPLLLTGRADRTEAMVYAVRFDAYRLARDEIKAAAGAPGGQVDPGTGLAASFSAEIERVVAATGSAATAIGAWSSWASDSSGRFVTPDQQAAVVTERDTAVRAARKAVEIAQSRRMFELAKRAVADWPQEGPAVGKRVKGVADIRISEGAYKKWNQPLVPMTEMENGGEFSREYHPDAAKEVLGDWSKLKDLVEPTSTGQAQMIGREALKMDAAYRGGAQATAKYVQTYIAFWRGQALETSRPTVDTWAEFAAKIKLIGHFDLKDELSRLHETVDSALKVPPDSAVWNSQLNAAKHDVTAAFAGLENASFVDETKTTLGQWKRLCSGTGGAAGARDTLLTAYTNGKAKEQYYKYKRRNTNVDEISLDKENH